MRKFEFVKRLENTDELKLPQRSTKSSAGYDFFAIEDVTIEPSIFADMFKKPVLIKTGIKAQMDNDEVLLLVNRSSNPTKKDLVMANDVGVIDADYYGNETNDGEIGFLFYNVGYEDVVIKKGDKLGQGMFMKYLTTEDDSADGIRNGGFGSTGK